MSDLADRIITVLGRGQRHARFVPEVARLTGDSDGLEEALERLEADGRVLIREQYCADPHVEGTDLRIVALASDSAIADIDAVWQRWLGEYLANHRCS
jgi:hypothetical protein